MSPQQPLVSVVMPVYNGEEFLREAIESVLAQTYSNWDFTIVNNCSTDATLQIAGQYARKDSRIRIHDNQEFLPMMRNINSSFRKLSPQSKYCKMLLADDWIFPECLERMVAVAEANPAVAVVGAYGLDGLRVMWQGLPYPSTVVKGPEIARATLLGGPYVFGSATSTLFRAELVRGRDPFFDEAGPQGDYLTCLELMRTYDFGFVHQILTFTRRRKNSATSLSLDLNTYILERLTALLKYGPVFLTPQECRQQEKVWRRDYYEFLARSALRLRERAFWRHHRTRLAQLGHSLSWLALMKALLVECLNGIVHPRLAFAAVWNWWCHAWQRTARRNAKEKAPVYP